MSWNDLVFERMDLVWLLALVPLMATLFLYDGVRVRRALSKLGKARFVERLMGAAPPWRRRLRRFLWLLALTFMVIAALRPKAGLKSQQIQHVGIDIGVILDVSRSMLVPDVPPTRLKAAIADISGLLSKLRGGRVALIPVAGVAFIQCPLTSDHEVIRQYLADLDVQDMPVPGTNLGHALDVALSALGVEPQEVREGEAIEKVHRYEGAKYRALVLLTDGEDFGQGIDDAIARVNQAGVPVFTVGVGTPSGKPVPIFDDNGKQTGVQKDDEGKPVFSGLNEDLLVQIAQDTGGSFHSLSQGSVVGSIFGQIDRMEKREYESQIRKLREDRFAIPLWFALCLLIMEWLISEYRRRKPSATQSARLAMIVLLLGGCSMDAAPFVVENSEVNRGLEAIKKGRSSEALEAMKAARAELPDQPALDLNEGLALQAMGEFTDAARRFERALERVPAKHRAKTLYALGLANAHAALAREREAASLSELQEEGDSEAAAEALTSWRRARDLFEEVLNKNPEHEGARSGLEVALYRTDPPCFMRDIEGEPDTPPAAPRTFPLDEESASGEVSSVLCPDDLDRFALAIKRNHRLFVTLEGEGDQGKAVMNPVGLPGLATTEARVEIAGYVAPTDLSMTLEVKHKEVLEGEVPYDLSAQVVPACKELDSEFPNDDSPGSANRVDDLMEAPLRLCPGDRDFFAVEVFLGQSILVLVDVTDPGQPAQGQEPKPLGRGPRLPGQPNDVAPQIRILDMELKVRAQGFGGSGRTLAVLPEPPPGGYFVEIFPPKDHPTLETPYRLTLLRIPPCPAGNLDDKMAEAQQKPPNDFPDQATALQPGAIALGRICSGDTDWYSVQAQEEKPTAVEILFDRTQAELEVSGYLGEDLDGDPIPAAATAAGAIFEVPKLEEAEAPRVRVDGEKNVGEGFYLVRHISQPPPQSSGENEKQNQDKQQDQQEQEQDKGDGEQDQPEQNQQQQKSPSALEQLLQDMDQNPRNLEADEAAKKAKGTIVLPLRDW